MTSEAQMREQLKPCPLCGGEAYLTEDPYKNAWDKMAYCEVGCLKCELHIHHIAAHGTIAKKWNKRVASINMGWEPEFFLHVRDGKVISYNNATAYTLSRQSALASLPSISEGELAKIIERQIDKDDDRINYVNIARALIATGCVNVKEGA